MSAFVIVTFYKFVALPDYHDLRDPLQACCITNQITGTILLAKEGINATIAGPQAGIEAVLTHLRKDPRLADLTWKTSYADDEPFYRMKVRLKKEIVKMGVPEVDPTAQVGTYVPAQAWNDLIADPDVTLIDTRNDFEVQMGTFRGAVNPHTTSFGEFPEYVARHLDPAKNKKVAMFCTGGIRCEKATSYLLQQGFEEVYHLHGGILKYLEDVAADQSLWEGECFVFDHRISVNHDLEPGTYSMCHACFQILTVEDRTSPHYEEGISCPHCHDTLPASQRARARERQKQVELARARQMRHLGGQRKEGAG